MANSKRMKALNRLLKESSLADKERMDARLRGLLNPEEGVASYLEELSGPGGHAPSASPEVATVVHPEPTTEQLRAPGSRLAELEARKINSIKRGDNDTPDDNSVAQIQQLLIDRGYHLRGHGVDGKFGTETRNAVSSFQRRNKNLLSGPTNGQVTLSTLDALQNTAAEGPPDISQIGAGLPCEGRTLAAFMRGMGKQESRGKYDAEQDLSKAYGKYQIMPTNWPGWSYEVFGERGVEQTPENQEAVAAYKICEYYQRYNEWYLVAVAWYGGPGAVTRIQRARESDPSLSGYRKRITYKGEGSFPGIATYADEIMEKFDRELGVVSSDATASNLAPSGMLILGDSQAVGNLGKEIEGVASDLIDNISYRGWTASDIPRGRVKGVLEGFNPELIVISLGGNGADGTEASLVQFLKDLAPMAKIIWIGAFPPTLVIGESWRKDLYTQDGVNAARVNRRNTNTTIRASIGSDVMFIDPPEYACTSNCDGIHLPSDVANNFVSGIFSSKMAQALSAPVSPINSIAGKLYDLNEYLVKNGFVQESLRLKSFSRIK